MPCFWEIGNLSDSYLCIIAINGHCFAIKFSELRTNELIRIQKFFAIGETRRIEFVIATPVVWKWINAMLANETMVLNIISLDHFFFSRLVQCHFYGHNYHYFSVVRAEEHCISKIKKIITVIIFTYESWQVTVAEKYLKMHMFS